MPLLRPWAMLLCLVGLSACTQYRDPTLRVSGVRVLDQTDEAVQLGFTIEMHNPNDEPLQLLNFEYQLTVNGVPVYTGMRAAEATLTRETTRYATLPAVIPYERARWTNGQMPETFDYRLGGRLGYVTPGEIAEILLDSGLRRPKVIFLATGTVETGEAEAEPAPVDQPAPVDAPAPDAQDVPSE